VPLRGFVGVPYLVALLALLLTCFETDHLTTPLTFTAVAGAAFVLLLRDRRPGHADALGGAVVLAAWAFAIYAVPETGRPPAEILPLLAAVTTALAVVFLLVAARLRRGPALAAAAAARLTRVAVITLLIAPAFVAWNVLALGDEPAAGLGLGLTALATVGSGLVATLLAVRRERPALLHVPVLAGLALHAFVTVRTDLLAGLDGHHLHLLAAIGAGLLVLGDRLGDPLRIPLRLDALLLPVLAAGSALLDLVGAVDLEGRGALAFFLAAAVYGVAAFRERRPALGWLSLALVDLALFSIWRHRGIVDPAFYGVPAGLSLVLGSEVARRGDARRQGAWLLAAGLVVLYGSVAVQVLRVEEPAHALVLFGLGLLSVAWGAVRARNDVLLAGTAAVVLDVVAYFVQHGFARDFVGAGLLVGSGLTVLAGGALAARRRRAAASEALDQDLRPETDQDQPAEPLGPGPDAGGEEPAETDAEHGQDAGDDADGEAGGEQVDVGHGEADPGPEGVDRGGEGEPDHRETS
jgi:hypothetical protein